MKQNKDFSAVFTIASNTAAEAFKLIIQESLNQNAGRTITNSALSKASERFGTFAADGSHIIPARDKES